MRDAATMRQRRNAKQRGNKFVAEPDWRALDMHLLRRAFCFSRYLGRLERKKLAMRFS